MSKYTTTPATLDARVIYTCLLYTSDAADDVAGV